MATRIRTLNFLPEVFRTPTNAQFLGATLDQIVDQPNTMKIEGYVGTKFGYGINAKDKYVIEPTKTRTDYQLDPGVVFTKTNTSTATDFVSYPGLVDAIDLNGGIVNNNDRLFQSQFYSWDPFVNLDTLINFNEYYWLPEGAPAVNITTDIVYNATTFSVEDLPNGYNISSDVNPAGSTNPTITLIRGGTYTFTVNQTSPFWIQGKPGVTGYDPSQPNVQTRDVLGVDNNGAEVGSVTFTVPTKTSQSEYDFPGNNTIDLVCTAPFDTINGQLLSTVKNIDGVTALNGRVIMFYNTGVAGETGFVGPFYDDTLYDQAGGNSPWVYPGTSADDNNFDGGYYTDVSANFYIISYEGSVSDPVLKLTPYGSIPTNEKIIPLYGTEWVGRGFYRNVSGTINLIPYLSSLLDTLYYQDGEDANKVGVIKLVDSNSTNQINILESILGKKTYTSPNNVVFTNGLKVSFSGDIYPAKYTTGEYYVEGVGTAIELINTQDLIVPEQFTQGAFVPYDTLPYDEGNYDVTLYVPVLQDYITIARNSIDRNPWSRSNRWFHIDVINATATYLNDPTIATTYATKGNKAKRPIIQFYPNLQLFNNAVLGKAPIDFLDERTTDAFTLVANQLNYWPDVEVYTGYDATIASVSSDTTTTIVVDTASVTGTFQVGQYVSDTTNILPRNTQIDSIEIGVDTITLTVSWQDDVTFTGTSVASIVANDVSNDNYSLFDGARIVFSADTNLEVRNKIYVCRFSSIDSDTSTPVITLTEADDGDVLAKEGTVAYKGYYNQGKDFYFDGLDWLEAQQKTDVNQAPYFDVFDENNISFGDASIYVGTSFAGCKLFSYGLGYGSDDSVLGFPLKYSSVNNIGDISFDIPLNSDTFTYVRGSSPITQKVNTGYVFNYSDIDSYARSLGWQTAVAPSRQYQIFSFDYNSDFGTTQYVCDVAAATDTVWPNVQVFVNNEIQPTDSYTVTINENTTVVDFVVPDQLVDTIVEIAIISDQVSETAYYQVPINLQNNPLNADITVANIGDIRGQYQSIFYNNPNTTGVVFGSNNYRDLGNLVPWGTKIIQNSASLALPGAFLRKVNHNLVDALQFNSQQYINFKTLLVDTIYKTDYTVRLTPAEMLDTALDDITLSKVESSSFFWSDMLPSKSAYITNTYTFANSLDVSRYPLSKIYNFSTANYNGVLVYLSRTISGNTTVTQLIINQDYTVSTDSPSLTITKDLVPGDVVTIKEYNQTYGSYVPNTPTKLGLYPSFVPSVVLDDNYSQPTYFVKGHDGSYTRLYGEYVDGQLTDFRDQVLLEFETRIYNNLKLSNVIPLRDYDVLPGFFRTTGYSYDEVVQIYSKFFLDWVGQNRLEYKQQFYSATDEYTWNYNQSGNRINKEVIPQGFWRGVYQYFYDTSEPDSSPWEMLGFTEMPTWWTSRYGQAPYTSDNLVLWNDLAQGINWNNGNPVVIEPCVRPELLQIIPVDGAGNLKSPFDVIVQNYTKRTFQNNWKVGDDAPVEFSYRRSSTWPFDLMKLLSLTRPAEFYNLGVDLDNYKYNEEFNQYLVNNRSHLNITNIDVYGSGTAKTSYINWIVDYEKQVGVDATQQITDLLDSTDVRLVYRLAGFSDKDLLNFYVEKGTPNSTNASLLIPNESYSLILYDNVPTNKLLYSGVVVQSVPNGWKVFGNSQTTAYFTVSAPKINGNYNKITIDNVTVQVAKDYSVEKTITVPYGTMFYSHQEVAQFLASYSNHLITQGVIFDQIESGLEVNWDQMIAEYLYWSQSGWVTGSLINLNPSANIITINKDSHIVQPLTLQRQNFILNQNLYPIQSVDISIVREGSAFSAKPLNQGDTVAYSQFNMSSIEHGIVFDNVTLFGDIIYNLTTGLRQNRILTRGTKSAEWNGTMDAQGFILNQDNIKEWSSITKYTKGEIVLYKNKYWIATKIIPASTVFDLTAWQETEYEEIQKGLLPNASTRSYESTLFYDTNKSNLDADSDLLSWSLIGYRPRDYLALADLTDITQVNVYKNMIKEKGTKYAANLFKGITLPQGGIDYDLHENWAIKTGDFGGVLDNNFVEFKLNQTELTGNPSIVSLTDSVYTDGSQQEVPLYAVTNYGRNISSPNILRSIPSVTPNVLYPDAGYANFDDVKVYSYYLSGLNTAVTPLSNLFVNEYVWLADYNGSWQVYTPMSNGSLIEVLNNYNGTVTFVFDQMHGLSKYQPIAVINFSSAVNGYYYVASIVDNYKVTVNFALDSTIPRVLGTGVVMKFQDQRVAQPSDIIDLPLLNSEFVKNKVWVDTNTDGSWAVYRKSINYGLDLEITKAESETFGSAVATTDDLGYLITDASKGEAYRYTYNPVFDRYDLAQTLPDTSVYTTGDSFGTAIAYSGDVFAISKPTGPLYTDRKIYLYKLIATNEVNALVPYEIALEATIPDPSLWTPTYITAPSTVTNWGSSLAFSGDGNWLYIGAYENNKVYVYRKSQVTELYEYATVIEVAGLSSGDNFGKQVSTNYYGDTVAISAPDIDASVTTSNTGQSYIFDRLSQTFEAQYTSLPFVPQVFNLAITVDTVTTTSTSKTGNYFTVTDASSLAVDMPVVFTGSVFGGVAENTVYYIKDISGNDISVSLTRGGTTFTLSGAAGSMTVTAQSTPVYVNVNGTLINDNQYAVIGTKFYVYKALTAGDIVTVSSQEFVLVQTNVAQGSINIGEQFGHSVAVNNYGSEILVSAPYEINDNNQEGSVYRFTNGGAKYGIIVGTEDCNVTTASTILLNGYAVTVPVGDATTVATAITSANITNVTAAASNGKLIISVINKDLAIANNKLDIDVLDISVLEELGITKYTNTQVILDPHAQGRTSFGYTVKFNKTNDSFVASSPVSTRYESTTFDSTDDDNYDNDTLFDNNTTQFIDSYINAGAAYMFDYLSNYDENLNNVGKFAYAQPVNSINSDYGAQPYYGTALDFNNNVIVGTPSYKPGVINGEVVIYTNPSGVTDWSVFRQSSTVVDIEAIQNTQLFDAITNNTLVNLDYIDPLQGKILGVVTQNIDVVSNADPAFYNSPSAPNATGAIWGEKQVGTLWFDTSTTKFVNYHQNDNVYNSKWWGQVFPGSDVTIYSWVTSTQLPENYNGPGTPKDVTSYVIQYSLNSTGAIVPVYFYWVRNTNIIFTKAGKNLSDTICESYISAPISTGIAYMAPLLSNTFALYNCSEYINGLSTVMHIGFATGENNDVSHSAWSLIRSNYSDDFLPGLPGVNGVLVPESLYRHLIESLSGVDGSGAVVPDPYLPKLVQSGILARPRQSFFFNRYQALKNYLTLANEILLQYPFAETMVSTFLSKKGAVNPSTVDNPNWSGPEELFYNTADYWEYVNWWATGYNDNTRAAMQVQSYYDLAAINAQNGLIVTVAQNSQGVKETYVYDNSIWTRIGLENGTIQFKSSLWDYEEPRLGFGDNFFDTTPYDEYPSEETANIIRFLNEDASSELATFRNDGLILLFNYIVSETIESQNYIPWLNKTSFIDVAHTIRELLPLKVFQSDNQDFLEGYINEVKPYHVVVKDFLFKYTGSDVWSGNVTDFDLPATYNTAYKKYITPELIYSNPSGDNQYLPTSSVWTQDQYQEWYNNYGLSITGVNDYPITTLESYVSLSSRSMIVDNVYGLPVNGVIQIGNEKIGYSSVDRAYSMIYGLTRGVDGTTIENHYPGDQIIMNLPAVLLLNAGRGYAEPPKVTAYIDTTLYPAPRRAAILEPVMNLDSILQINVIDPGDGYVVLPEILIEPSSTVTFTSSNIDLVRNTIAIQNQLLQTGDLVKYYVEDGTEPVAGLKVGQYYYVGVLEATPEFVISLYASYADALQDTNRVVFKSTGSGTGNKLANSARASCVSSALPIRENNITLRFDRTSYTSRVVDWTPAGFYGSYYAGRFTNSEEVASSAITLQNTQPPIASILASAEGAVFEIQSVRNETSLTWSSRTRVVDSTQATSNLVTISPSSGGAVETDYIGPTTGFYVGMPVKFTGASFGGLVDSTTYYINSIDSLTEFSLVDENGDPVVLSTATAPVAGLTMYIGQVTDIAILDIQYPGILQATATAATTNYITTPLLPSGIGGTNGFYVGLPIIFTGTTFGGVVENEEYYVITVVDEQTFTISENSDPIMLDVTSVDGATDYIKVSSVSELNVNDPIIFTDMVEAGVAVTNFGGIAAGQVYYIANDGIDYTQNRIKISETRNGGVVNLTTVLAASDTGATLINQKDALALTNASGSMTLNVGLPISPGQITGQQFRLYNTSGELTNSDAGYTGTNGNLLSRRTEATVTVGLSGYLFLNELDGGTSNMYANMPFEVAEDIGGLIAGTTYTVESLGTVSTEVTASSSSTNIYTCDSTEGFYVGMPIVFSGGVFGNVELLITYYVKTVDSSTEFTISVYDGGPTFTLTTSSGEMTVTCINPYVEVTDISATEVKTTTFDQTPTSVPSFFVKYLLGGYSITINDVGAGYAVDNTITIPGNSSGIDGQTPLNDITLTVSSIDETDGSITSVIVAGTPPGEIAEYYLKVVGETELAVYSNQSMTVPVPYADVPYIGISTATATETVASTDRITFSSADDVAQFNINDSVVFTGEVFGNIVLGQTYYIYDKPTSTTVRIAEELNSASPFGLSDASGTMTMGKPGDYILLPEPFYFNQSIVRYNNKVWQCIVSNNDNEFILGKWELLDSGNRKLNELDRVIGYYQPTVNMPGRDLSQLFDGITYPNNTYYDNAFPPDEEYPLDTVLQDQPFYPSNINNMSVCWNGTEYLTVANNPDYSAAIASTNGDTWTVDKLANENVSVTDVACLDDIHVITTNNHATPIYVKTVDSYTTTPAITVESNSLNSVAHDGTVWVAAGENIVRSEDTETWTETFTFNSFNSTGELTAVEYINIPTNYVGWLAIGNWVDDSIYVKTSRALLLQSNDGVNWSIINRYTTTVITDATLNDIASGSSTIIIVADSGRIFTSLNGGSFFTEVTSGTVENLNNVHCNAGTAIAVGNNGVILRSDDDGSTWSLDTLTTTETLNGVSYNETDSQWIIVGENNTILLSDDDGVTWTVSSVYTQDPTVYDVQGDPFTAGYGPEELVPGVVSDNLTMIVNTRPGTNWEVGQYGHTGFNVVSIELTPESLAQTEFSFLNIVQNPGFLTVFDLDTTTGYSTRIYDFTVNWITKTITLSTALAVNHKIIINIYEVGNGDQLVKSNSQVIPFVTNATTGFVEMPMNCNYSANRFNGSGVVRPGTDPKQVECTRTNGTTNEISCDSVGYFALNGAITFQGDLLGGLQPDTDYYVKTISTVSSKITVSDQLIDGIAGPTFELTEETGSMQAIIQTGNGLVWSDPYMMHNGSKLILGNQSIVTETKSSSNSVVCNTTSGFAIGDTVTFSDSIFGGLDSQFSYTIFSIVDGNEFTVEDPDNPGSPLTLADATGVAICITNDYAIAIADEGITAKVVFANQYNQTNDYIELSLFGETAPAQYAYSIPETEVFTAAGGETEYELANYVGETNPENAIVEKNGLRLIDTTDYTIDFNTQSITLVSPLVANDVLSVTSYGSTQRQYLVTDFNVTGKTVADITLIDNNFTGYSGITTCTATTVTTNVITCNSTSGFSTGLQVQFKGIEFGDILTDGTVYFVDSVISATEFTIKDEYGTQIALTTDTGSVVAYVGGLVTAVVYTGTPHNLSTGDFVRIDGTQGSAQLNNQTFYVQYITENSVALYQTEYDPALNAVNDYVTLFSVYTGGGYIWKDATFTLLTTTATATTSTGNIVTVDSTDLLELNTPIYFSGTVFGGIEAGTRYYIKTIESATEITISATYSGDEFVLTSASGSMGLTQWEQENVDRLWVTINGYRIPSSGLHLNPNNNLSILSTIVTTDDIIITNMIPTASPNGEVYIQNVTKSGSSTVYRANSLTRTWLTQPLRSVDSIIYLEDVSKITTTLVQSDTVPAAVDGVYSIGLEGDKSTITQIIVQNGATTLTSEQYYIAIEDTAPVLKITTGVTEGDTVTITQILGNLIYLDGEQIKFTTVDFENNTLTGLQRGANGTGERDYIAQYETVYGILSMNELPSSYYGITWNSYTYNPVEGDPLQISTTAAANFLKADYE